MSLNQISENAVNAIADALAEAGLSDTQKSEVARIVSNAMRDAAHHCRDVHQEATVQCCGPEADMAHKIAEASRKKNRCPDFQFDGDALTQGHLATP
eukprot:UN02472